MLAHHAQLRYNSLEFKQTDQKEYNMNNKSIVKIALMAAGLTLVSGVALAQSENCRVIVATNAVAGGNKAVRFSIASSDNTRNYTSRAIALEGSESINVTCGKYYKVFANQTNASGSINFRGSLGDPAVQNAENNNRGVHLQEGSSTLQPGSEYYGYPGNFNVTSAK